MSSRTALGGSFVSHVPPGTDGRVTSTRTGLFGDVYVTVDFENGYTEEVKTAEIRYESGWF